MGRGRVVFLVFVILGLLTGEGASAEESSALFRGIRPLGMGGAFITLSDDESALFYNPAGLNDVKGFGGVQILNPLFEINDNSRHIYDDVRGLNGSNIAEVVDFLNRHTGEHQHLRAALFPNLFFHNFAFGLLGNAVADLDIRNLAANPEVVTNLHLDTGILVGAAYGLFHKIVQIGVTVKGVRREGINGVYTAIDIASGQFDPYHQRTHRDAIAFDAGAKLNLPVLLRPTVALVLQNITDLDFGTLGKIPQQLNAGVGINPNFWIISSSVVVEVDDVTKQVGTDSDLYKRVHLGAELRFPKILSVRGGVNQGYYTAGATLDFWILKLAYATYAEELGAFAGQRADRRHVAQVSLGF